MASQDISSSCEIEVATVGREDARLAALAAYGVLDTPPEPDFDDLATIASYVCGTPVALVTLLDRDRQFFKSHVGTEIAGTPIDMALCSHVMARKELLVIADLAGDARTRDNPLVTGEEHIRFYAGAPLLTQDGHMLGTLCVLDRTARSDGLTDDQERTLRALARQVMAQLELRRAVAARDAALRDRAADQILNRQIVDSAVDYGIITMDLHGDVTSWNVGAERILGWTEQEILGRPADVFFTPEDVAAQVPETEMRHAREHGRGADERWHLRQDGSRFFAMGEMMPLTSALGDQIGYLKILRDQTQRREGEERLARADERLQIALAASGVIGLWDWMVDTDLLHGDANFARLYGLDAEKTLAGLTMEEYQEFVVPEDLADLRASIRATFDRGEDFLVEYRLAIPGETLRWVECRGQLLAGVDGRPERFSGSAIDITERKHAESEIRRLAGIVEQSGDFIGVAALNGRVQWVNQSGRELVGLPDEASARETTIQDYFDPVQWPEIAETVFPAVQRESQWRGELRFRHFQTGEIIPVIYDVMALRDPDGAVIAYATVTRDIREQKDAETRQRILNEELSHRMKNTLAMVQAIAQQTLKGVTEKDAVEAFKKRLHAISSAHGVLLQQSWSAAPIRESIRAVLGTFEMNDRFDVSGPDVNMGPRATLSLSLLMHELSTNALKYGALSADEGRVAVRWEVCAGSEGDDLVLRWQESGGPPPRAPERRGFGSRLIEMGLTGTGGSVLHYPSTGFEAEFTAPLNQVRQL